MEKDKHRGSLGAKFEGLKAAPSAELWGSIADSLDGKKKKKAIVWWWISGGLAAVGLFGMLLVNWKQIGADSSQNFEPIAMKANWSENENNLFLAKYHKMNDTVFEKENTETLEEEEPNLTHFEQNISNKSSNKNKIKPNFQKQDRIEPTNNIVENGETPKTGKKLPVILPNQSVVLSEYELASIDVKKVERELNVGFDPLLSTEMNLIALAIQPIKNNPWEIGVGINRGRGHNSIFKSTEIPQIDTIPTTVISQEDTENDSKGFNANPIRNLGFKFHLGYQIADKWIVTSGLLFDQTKYDFGNTGLAVGSFSNSADLVDFYAKNLKVRSIGIPLGINYQFFSNKRVQMSTGADLINEFYVQKFYNKYLFENQGGDNMLITPSGGVATSQKNLFKSNGYGLAVGLNIGASYYLSEKIRLRFRPGVRWYLHKQQNLEVNLKQKRLLTGLELDLIWKL